MKGMATCQAKTAVKSPSLLMAKRMESPQIQMVNGLFSSLFFVTNMLLNITTETLEIP